MTDIQLSPEQEAAAQACEEYLYRHEDDPESLPKPFFVLEGYAGTGKSFTIGEIIKRTGRRPAFMTYTGKAALVLNRYNNLGATTIHSRIYKLRHVPDKVFEDLYQQKETEPERAAEIDKEIKELMQPQFELDPEAFAEEEEDLIVLDECSMVDDTILKDLLSYNLPIVALGDPGQLPPVKGEGALFKGVPDARLTEIRRQALDNPIIEWSFYARKQRPLPATDFDTWKSDKAAKIPKAFVKGAVWNEMFDEHDMAICWRNKTRMAINEWRRRALGYRDTFPEPGERLIITKNDKGTGLFNGQFVVVKETGELMDDYIELTVEHEDEELRRDPIQLKVLRACFEQYRDPDAWDRVRPWHYRGTQQADFGYAITCHKAQGSQWDRVLVIEENAFNWQKNDGQARRAEWLYTAITRAVDKVTIIAGR